MHSNTKIEDIAPSGLSPPVRGVAWPRRNMGKVFKDAMALLVHMMVQIFLVLRILFYAKQLRKVLFLFFKKKLKYLPIKQ